MLSHPTVMSFDLRRGSHRKWDTSWAGGPADWKEEAGRGREGGELEKAIAGDRAQERSETMHIIEQDDL